MKPRHLLMKCKRLTRQRCTCWYRWERGRLNRIWVEHLPVVRRAMEGFKSYQEVTENLPDIEIIKNL